VLTASALYSPQESHSITSFHQIAALYSVFRLLVYPFLNKDLIAISFTTAIPLAVLDISVPEHLDPQIATLILSHISLRVIHSP